MGTNNQGYVLVIMTNKDVYYIYQDELERLEAAMEDKAFFKTFDAKSGARINLNTEFISSVVKERNNA